MIEHDLNVYRLLFALGSHGPDGDAGMLEQRDRASLDFGMLSILATLTGDGTFLAWRPAGLPVRVDSNPDVPLLVYEHAVLCGYAHARLCQLRAKSAPGHAAAPQE